MLSNVDLGGQQASADKPGEGNDQSTKSGDKEEQDGQKKEEEEEQKKTISEQDKALNSLVDFSDLKKDKIAAEKEEELKK